MADEIIDDGTNSDVSATEKRIKDLSQKVKLTSEERDEQTRLLNEKDALLTTATKERDFFQGFSTQTSKYPAAAEFQDKIKEKVMAGYDVEDATVAVLSREGKFTGQSAPAIVRESPAGGSAPTNIKVDVNKPINEMTREEKRAAILELERKGDISVN